MSSVVWQGDKLIQRWRDKSEELGFVQLDQDADTVSLWLRPTGSAENADWFFRGAQYESMAEAKKRAAFSSAVDSVHMQWLHQIALDEASNVVDKNWDEISQQVPGSDKAVVKTILAGILARLGYDVLSELGQRAEPFFDWIINQLGQFLEKLGEMGVG